MASGLKVDTLKGIQTQYQAIYLAKLGPYRVSRTILGSSTWPTWPKTAPTGEKIGKFFKKMFCWATFEQHQNPFGEQLWQPLGASPCQNGGKILGRRGGNLTSQNYKNPTIFKTLFSMFWPPPGPWFEFSKLQFGSSSETLPVHVVAWGGQMIILWMDFFCYI